ncbi:AraC family transcriptional regulator [Leptospira congkakensis]|uniref:AraC family transcriptional regulator n=1 Tax=Leptospira congkakensis TaxID=2484932 RepID=A0A4Z1ADJ4_9LEPT|nr:GyrI-like domain-containing protein [Leptospira congkakensis]TGL90666.1 AraC family transcriptional regulator [Leptospira congkakensis]TGL91673.1 AraC family transcriptional regulator [Leptospira congkakensis]TGL98725.1 AraC family transcriptional regulator [Leptospira congkakensis]
MENKTSEKIQLNPITVVGIKTRTSNEKEMAGNGKIAALWEQFLKEEILSQIPNRTSLSEWMVVYTEFESDENGEYTMFIGASVNKVESLKPHLSSIQIPGSRYLKVPTEWGHLTTIGLETWKKIWTEDEYKKKRTYIADLEIYGTNAMNPINSQFDIYLGIK